MDLSLYDAFKHAIAVGDRAKAATALKPFIETFTSMDEKTAWAIWFLENEDHGHRIRHEIYEHLVFPVLLQGYRLSDPWSLRWLARTSQNLYSSKTLWSQIDFKTEQLLLTELVDLCPEDKEARNALLHKLVASFEYMEHEWPSGILYGHDGASAEECAEILREVEFAKRLDSDGSNGEYLASFETKVNEYQARLGRACNADLQ